MTECNQIPIDFRILFINKGIINVPLNNQYYRYPKRSDGLVYIPKHLDQNIVQKNNRFQ